MWSSTLEDCIYVADQCDSFDGDESSYGRLLQRCFPAVIPLHCIHASIFSLTSSKTVITCKLLDQSSQFANIRDDSPVTNVIFARSTSAGVAVVAHAFIFDRSILQSEQQAAVGADDWLVGCWQTHGACWMQSRLLFAVRRDEYPQAELSRLVRLMSPHLHAALMRVAGKDTLFSQLTNSERTIAYWLVRGLPNKEIAKVLRKSEATIRNQLHSIFVKLDVKQRPAAVQRLAAYIARLDPGMRERDNKSPVSHTTADSRSRRG